jgi:CubicO group peptidase (beta-lactamase class C family)
MESRIARIGSEFLMGDAFPEGHLINQVIPKGMEPGSELWNRSDIRQASIPGAGAIVSARALARHYAALCGEGVDGLRLVPPERTRIAATLQTEEPDVVMFESPVRKGLGYWLGGPISPMGDYVGVFGHEGSGGSIGFADPENRFALALTKNKLTWSSVDEATDRRVIRAVRESLGILGKNT